MSAIVTLPLQMGDLKQEWGLQPGQGQGQSKAMSWDLHPLSLMLCSSYNLVAPRPNWRFTWFPQFFFICCQYSMLISQANLHF